MSTPNKILVVNYNRRNLALLAGFLEKMGYSVCRAATLEELDKQLMNLASIKLALIDISGFDKRIWEKCEQLRNQSVPFLIIYPEQLAKLKEAGLASGATDMMVKPLVQRKLLAFIESLMSPDD
ncbi:MAG: DNA-binding response regulator [Chloroflexi bacterium]|nr:MAG: DNA-binding response regulator [Chloroflexota bacterium]